MDLVEVQERILQVQINVEDGEDIARKTLELLNEYKNKSMAVSLRTLSLGEADLLNKKIDFKSLGF